MLAHKFEQMTLTRTGLGVINTLKYYDHVKTGAKAHHIQVGLPNAIYPTGWHLTWIQTSERCDVNIHVKDWPWPWGEY